MTIGLLGTCIFSLLSLFPQCLSGDLSLAPHSVFSFLHDYTGARVGTPSQLSGWDCVAGTRLPFPVGRRWETYTRYCSILLRSVSIINSHLNPSYSHQKNLKKKAIYTSSPRACPTARPQVGPQRRTPGAGRPLVSCRCGSAGTGPRCASKALTAVWSLGVDQLEAAALGRRDRAVWQSVSLPTLATVAERKEAECECRCLELPLGDGQVTVHGFAFRRRAGLDVGPRCRT